MGGILNYNRSNRKLPEYFSYQEIKDMTRHLNVLFKQNEVCLKFGIRFHEAELKYNNQNWQESIMPGVLFSVGKNDEKTSNIAVKLHSLYRIYENMKHFQKKLEEEKKLVPSTITPDESQECCICMEKAPTMVLPCSHQYCDKCTQIHIIDSEEKRCPLCRTQFKCGRESLSKKIYEIIEEDSLYEELRSIILEEVAYLNRRAVNNLSQESGFKEE